MQYTDNEAALIGGLISNYFLRPAVSAALKDSYTRVLEHLRTGRVSAADLKQVQKALAFLTPTCQMSREAQRDLMGASLKTTALLSSCHKSLKMLPAYVPAAFFLYRKERPEGRSSQMKQVTYGIYGCKGKAGCKALDTDLHPIHRQ